MESKIILLAIFVVYLVFFVYLLAKIHKKTALPILDLLDDRGSHYYICFIPENSVSSREKESVSIAKNSGRGRIIYICLEELQKLMQQSSIPTRITHCGGTRFIIKFASNHISSRGKYWWIF